MFKNLSDVKRKINIGNRVIIRNYIKDDFEEREVTNKNTISITTYSPTRISTSKSKIVNGAYQILKKVIPDAFSNGIEGAGSHPTIINLAMLRA